MVFECINLSKFCILCFECISLEESELMCRKDKLKVFERALDCHNYIVFKNFHKSRKVFSPCEFFFSFHMAHIELFDGMWAVRNKWWNFEKCSSLNFLCWSMFRFWIILSNVMVSSCDANLKSLFKILKENLNTNQSSCGSNIKQTNE